MKQVESIEYLPPEIVPDNRTRKTASLTCAAKRPAAASFIVEMQLNWTTAFKERVLFNAAKAYVRQIDRSEEYKLLQPVYSLNLVNTTFEPDTDNCYHYYSMVHHLDTKKKIDGLHLVFVELPKFKPQSFAEKKMAVLWPGSSRDRFEDAHGAANLDNPSFQGAGDRRGVRLQRRGDGGIRGYWDARREATFVGELNARAELPSERAGGKG